MDRDTEIKRKHSTTLGEQYGCIFYRCMSFYILVLIYIYCDTVSLMEIQKMSSSVMVEKLFIY